VALLLVAGTVAVLAAAWPRLTHFDVEVNLIAADDPYVTLDREITAEFGMRNPVVWLIEAREGTVWTPALLARVQALTRDVFTIPGVIALDVVSLASPNMRDLRVTEEAMEPVYLMGQVPETQEAIAALRQRVDGDPNYGGTLVSRDGRAAMLVANFIDAADPQAVAAAALALRDRYRDATASVFVVGGSVLGAVAPQAARPVVAGALLTLGVGWLVLAVVGGINSALAATLAAVLAVVWTVAVVLALAAAVLPWSAYAVLPTVLIAVAVATTSGTWRERLDLGVALGMGFIALGVVAGAPAAAFGIAGAAGIGAAVLAGQAARALCGGAPLKRRSPRWMQLGALALAGIALVGVIRLHTSFGLFGYGARYLPESAVGDLRALERHFPPPTALAIRFRGEPGFVESPDVLRALEGLANAVRNDPAVGRVLSLADVVKMVHRAFNENRDEFLVIPADRGLIARYLALAYSPGFRRFVDRAFTRSALWVYLSSERPADLRRVFAAIEAQLAAHPVPSAEVDLIGGDGAVVLATARAARRLAVGTLAFLLLSVAGVGVLCGARAGTAALAGGAAATAFATGAFGWLGVPIDLVSFPALIAAAVAGTAFGALGDAGITAAALAVMALLGLAGSLAGANLIGAVVAVFLAAPALAGVIAQWVVLHPSSEPETNSRRRPR
jgi:predicted RND superfamily exporter protein